MQYLTSALALLFAASSPPAAARTPIAARDTTVSCPRALDWVADRVQRDYAGWDDAVTDRTRRRLEALTDSLREAAQAARTPDACLEVLSGWIGFFRDGHMRVFGVPTGGDSSDTTAAAIRARFADWPSIPLDEAEVRRRLADQGGTRDPAEGVWKVLGADYRMAVVHDPGDREGWVAVVLKADGVWWRAGQVKARLSPGGTDAYEVRYYMQDHSERDYQAREVRDLLVFPRVGWAWTRLYPPATDPVDTVAYAASLNDHFGFDRLDDRTAVIHLPTFQAAASPIVDSLFDANADVLRTLPNLIVDVRGNGGGSDYTYHRLIPLLYTGPITVAGVQRRATPDNIAAREKLARNPSFPEHVRQSLQREADSLRAHLGDFVTDPGETIRLDSVLPFPQRVAVLMDGGCGSSCEQFILAARESEKVKLYGGRTAGVLDHANVVAVDVPGTPFRLQYGTSRSLRLPDDPVDPDGIAPDVPVPDDELFPLEWVRRHMEMRSGR